MVLRNVLDFLIPILWVLVLVGFAYYLWRVIRRRGPLVALRQLLSKRVLAPLIGLLAITFISASLVFIDPREVGVVVSLFEPNGYRERPLKSGLHLIVPLAEQVARYPIIKQTYTMSGRPYEGAELGDDAIRARTADGQLVIIDITAGFRIDADLAVKLHIDWQDRYIVDFLRPGLRAFVRSEASQFTVADINSAKRKAFEDKLNQLIQKHCLDSGIAPDIILVRNITFSPEYALSVEEKMTAEQRVEEARYKASQVTNLAKGEANQIRIRADARAEAIRAIAEAEATAQVVKAEAEAEALNLIADALDERDNLLTYRYIDKLSPNISAMLLPNDAPLILPTPQLGSPKAQPAVLSQPPLPEAVPVQQTPLLVDPVAPATADAPLAKQGLLSPKIDAPIKVGASPAQ